MSIPSPSPQSPPQQPDFLTPLHPPTLPILLLPLHKIPQTYITLFTTQPPTQLNEITPTWSDQKNVFAKRYARGEIRYTWFRDTRFEQQATHRETKRRRRRGGKENKRRREKEEIAAAAAEREQEVEEGDVEMNRLRNQKREKINRVPPSLTVL